MPGHEPMLFHEIYGSYYQTVAKILAEAVRGDLEKKDIYALVEKYAFGESWNDLTRSLMEGDWPFLDGDMQTELLYEPAMPLTTLQKRWLQTVLADPRLRLFADIQGQDYGVEPLFRQEDIVYFDRYADADPYEDPGYRSHFRRILCSLREGGWLEVTHRNRLGRPMTRRIKPLYLEYSPRDDKFRLHAAGGTERAWPGTVQINLARILSCSPCPPAGEAVPVPAERKQLELILTDRRELLERFMRLFCYLEKRTVPIEPEEGTARYRVSVYYEPADEPEMLIRLLSLGNDIRILAPESLRAEIARRVRKQKDLLSG